MIFITLFWGAFAAMALTCVQIVRRRMTIRLAAWTVFIAAVTTQHLILGFNFGSFSRYVAIEAAWAPWLAILQAAAGIEAFALLANSLVNFRKIGAIMFIVIASATVLFERLTADPRSDLDSAIQGVMAIERGVGLAMGVTLAIAWVAFSLLDAPRMPRCHAFCLAALSIGSSLGWQFKSARTVMLAVIAALALWNICVRKAPDWKSPLPDGDYPTEEINKGWRRFDRKAGS